MIIFIGMESFFAENSHWVSSILINCDQYAACGGKPICNADKEQNPIIDPVGRQLCSPLSAPPTARHSASSCCMLCANMWLIAGLCQKCRSTKTLAAVSLPTRHTHQTLPVAVTMCHFKASCLCSPSLYIYLYVSLLLFQSVVSVGSVWIAEQNCSKLKRRTQQGVNLTRVLLCHLSALLRLLRLHCTAPLPCRFNDIWGFYAGTMC